MQIHTETGDGGGELVMVVEDEGMMRDILGRTLVRWGYKPILCETGPQGIETFDKYALASQFISLVITDLSLPGCNGYAVARQIKQKSPDTPIIMLTGSADGDDVVKIPEIDLVLPKPIPRNELKAAIENCLRLN